MAGGKSTRVKAPGKQQRAAKAAPRHSPANVVPRVSEITEHPINVTCRSRPNSIKDYTSQLDGTYLKMFEHSCFGHLIHLPSVSFCSTLVHNVMLRRKDPSKDDDEEEAMSFIIGNQEICFGEREFAMMSGLNFQGTEKIDMNFKKIPLMEAHFPGKKNVKLADVIEKFKQLPNSEDKLKLGLLCIAENVIMGCGLDVNVNKRHFLLVNNLKEFNNYPWGKLSYRATRRSLINASNKTDISKAEKTLGALVYNLYGFPHVFQAWIFQSIPSLTEKYAVKNKDCPQALHPRILRFKVTRTRRPLHKQILKELSCVDIKVLSPLHPTKEELKEGYMAGFLSDEEVSGATGHENDPSIQELNGEDKATEEWEANFYSNPTNSLEDAPAAKDKGLSSDREVSVAKRYQNDSCIQEFNGEDEATQECEANYRSNSSNSLKVGKQNGTTTKEVITLAGGEDQDVECLEDLKFKLRSEIDKLNKEREELGTDRYKLLEENAILNFKKLKLGRDTELLNEEKMKLQSDVELLNKEKSTVQVEICLLNEKKIILESEIELLSNEKTNLCNETELLNKEKTKLPSDLEFLHRGKSALQGDICSPNGKKTTLQDDICSLDEKKTAVQDDICSLNEKKATVQDDICSLNEKKFIVQGDVCWLNEKKITIQDDICLIIEKKTIIQGDIRSLSEKKTNLESEIESLSNQKTNLGNDNEFLDKEKTRLQTEIEILNKERTEVRSDFEFLIQEKTKLGTNVKFLLDEKNKLQADIEFHNGEKTEFIRSVMADLSKSFYEREKTLAENEKMFIELKEINQTLVAEEKFYTEELQEARQVLIKQMESEKATTNTVIGVKKRKRRDPELWNFRENKRATLKEVICFQLNRTDK
ncbi:uncharacterized protein PFB0145c-like isoform X2 [Papaver somniferum]|uniref:uncharacterized protein PFB0145c-like isoform X2 n=1 Tax=Papaver somniferum TaxID=3469 RepID=UPI000E6FADDF|nr:uncharacterized protein PFB0145c-like isoform X2 [Papaver somniferum]